MGGTSLPLGIKNSNCVIAAHRGYKGIPYFREIERLKTTNVKPNETTNEFLRKMGTTEITAGVKLSELLKRTELNYDKLSIIDLERPELSKAEAQEVEIQVKYEGYIKMQEEHRQMYF